MTTRQEQLEQEKDATVNPLIPGGWAARKAELAQLDADTSAEGVRNRQMDPAHNPLIPQHGR